MRTRFTKMHGCGNDFAVFEGLSREVKFDAQRIRKLADRRFGVGFDQLLVVEPPLRPSSDFALAIYNADGSPAAHCGNGARCAAQFALDNALTTKETLAWDLAADDARVNGFSTRQVGPNQFEVHMGVPSLDPREIPFRANEAEAGSSKHTWTLEVDSERIDFVPIGLGNPHAVVLVEDIDSAPVQRLGAAFAQHPAFPEGVNLGFCQPQDAEDLRLRVFERGVGETLACGSGACAAAAACKLLGRTNNRVRVRLPGGSLEVEWQGEGHELLLTGPAATSFRGQLSL